MKNPLVSSVTLHNNIAHFYFEAPNNSFYHVPVYVTPEEAKNPTEYYFQWKFAALTAIKETKGNFTHIPF